MLTKSLRLSRFSVDTDGMGNLISRGVGGITDPSVSVSLLPDRPPAPVNVSVMHLRADSATVSWEVPEGDIIIGFSISQQVTPELLL